MRDRRWLVVTLVAVLMIAMAGLVVFWLIWETTRPAPGAEGAMVALSLVCRVCLER